MSETKFTPGKWAITVDKDFPLHIVACEGNIEKTLVAVPISDNVSDEVARANANLIAAAPELIEALQELVHEQCQLTCKDHDKECTPTCWGTQTQTTHCQSGH